MIKPVNRFNLEMNIENLSNIFPPYSRIQLTVAKIFNKTIYFLWLDRYLSCLHFAL